MDRSMSTSSRASGVDPSAAGASCCVARHQIVNALRGVAVCAGADQRAEVAPAG